MEASRMLGSSNRLTFLFVGTVILSKSALEKFIEIGRVPVGVVTKESSPFNADYAALAPVCEKHDIPCRFTKDINCTDSVQWIKDKKPDVIFCFGWSSLIKKPVLDIPPLGIVGFHPAALPQNRGRHPLVWALALGLNQTASTFFFMDEGADTGDILSQKNVAIDYEDTAKTLYDKITDTALRQIQEFVPQLEQGNFQRQPQDHAQANIWRKRGKKDGKIDFRLSSRNIYNLVRALTKPYVGSHLEYHGQEIKIWKAEEHEYSVSNIEPGKVVFAERDSIVVKCGDKSIRLIEHELEQLPRVGEYIL
jgi:methionyl-tRNA formyltransferase